MKREEDDEFDFDSSDEAELVALSQSQDVNPQGTNVLSTSTPRSMKRKSSSSPPPAKRIAIESIDWPSATKTLQKSFGMKEFRLKQKAVISRILGGESAAVVFPTGGGKSLCFQIPALCFSEDDERAGERGQGEHGITLVVSPLIALMKDQCDALVRRGIRAAAFDSTKTREEYLATCDMLKAGELKLLYCAPERLNNEGFIEQMKHVRGGIRLLAVDEAHCISEWGHAFRPDYLKIARFAQEICAERVVCLTATATPRVASDICKAFDIDENVGLFRTSTYRPNLQLLAESGKDKKELLPKLFKFLKDNPGPTIVYVTLQKHTEDMALELKRQGFRARSFHAGMDAATKANLQDDFMRSDDLIIVATIAFGMGIDKADIRNVVHFNIPQSLESYSQEIGRAGRDGKVSKCMFYVCGEDLHLREMFARGDLPSKEGIRGVLQEIFSVGNTNQPIGSDLQFNHYAQEREYDIRTTTLKNIYAQLELTYELIRATTPIYTKYTWKGGPGLQATLNKDKSPVGVAIRNHSKFGKSLYTFDMDSAIAASGLQRGDVLKKLQNLHDDGELELKPAGVMNVYKVMQKLPKTAPEVEKLVGAIYDILQKREQEAMERTDEMLKLITGEACFSRSLAQHFGDGLLDGKKECGHCTWCMTHKAVEQEMPPPVPFNFPAWKAVLAAVEPRDDARLIAKVAFGMSSPRISYELKLSRHDAFGSMADHDFMVCKTPSSIWAILTWSGPLAHGRIRVLQGQSIGRCILEAYPSKGYYLEVIST
ncbi:related to QDE3 protein (involved in gene silencing) [Phialocephala subalpina]|uniref:ATP-dependent DNA helicase n=1 Tax=Phialocephala subalpina TaxID=576137 RepID=A0A1L7XWN2_9HELO|nr:related to QDE3 protein (involved in gene silencing) [Phialocephala subalpina]